MLEKQVIVRCRKKDEELVKHLLPECLEELQRAWGSTTEVFNFYGKYLEKNSFKMENQDLTCCII